jgi:hypothetical protein
MSLPVNNRTVMGEASGEKGVSWLPRFRMGQKTRRSIGR